MSIDWIVEGLKQEGKSKSGLAKVLGRSPSTVTDLLNNQRQLKFDEVPKVEAYLGVKAPGRDQKITTVRLVGYVGAGAAATLFGEGNELSDEVNAPPDATEYTVAVEIRGTSLGELFDTWLVFYDDVQDPPGGRQLGKLCVCGLEDGRVLIKKLKRGQLHGYFTLLSNTEPPIYDVAVKWAAVVKSMSPR